MSYKTKKSIRILLIVAFVFITASIFRLTNLDLVEFKSDEAANLLLSSRQIFDQPIPPGGTGSSVGILNPPLFNYIILPLTYLTLDPQKIVFFIALVNVLSIVFFFFVIKRYYSLVIAFISSSLIALSPWAILFSRKIWMQDILIPFFVPFFLSLHKLVIDKREIYWIPYVSFSFFLIQLHQASIFLLAPITAFLIIKKVKINYKYILVGAAIGIIPLIPYLIYELSNGCPDCVAILMSSQKLQSPSSLEIFQRPLQILGQGNFDFVFGAESFNLFSKEYKIAFELRKVLYLFYFIIPFSAFIFVRLHKKFDFFIYSLITTCAIYYFLKIEPRMHYFILFIPILALLIGVAFDSVIERGKMLKIASILLLSTIFSILIIYNFIFFDFVKKHKGTSGDYGTTYTQTKENTDRILQGFKERADYDEISLAIHIPLRYAFGFMPLSKMLYPGEITKEKLFKLEESLVRSDKDPRLNLQLISYYTKNEPYIKTIKLLKTKTEKIPEYKTIYEEVLSYYRSINFLKIYRSERNDFEFFYPEHWKIEENESIYLYGDGYMIVFSKLEHKRQIQGKNFFKTIKIGDAKFSTEIIPIEDKRAKYEDIKNTIEKITESIIL